MKNFYPNKILSIAALAATLSFCGITAEVRAQSNINDDLQPKTESKPVREKSGKPSQSRKKPAPIVYHKPIPTPAAAPPRSNETPTQTIARFMNFQQSYSVSGADWDNAISQLNSALQANPGDKMAKTQLAIAQGQIAYNRGDYSNALIQFNAATQLMPESALGYYGIGKVYLNTKQPIEAEKAFEKATKLNRSFALAYKGEGDAVAAQGKTKKAQDFYKQAAQIGVNGNEAGDGSGSRANNKSKTAATAPAAPAPPPESPYDRDLKAARALTAQKKWSQSLSKLQTLAPSNPTPEVYLLMGDNYYGMKAWISAQQAYQKTMQLNPNSAIAYYKSGQVLFETNEYQASAEAFEKSLILDQMGKTINRALARKWADRASERARNGGKDKKKFLIL